MKYLTEILTTLTKLFPTSLLTTNKNQVSDLERILQSAKQGDANAQFNLGELYFIGESIEQDYQQARYWYQKAAEYGHTEAQYSHCTTKEL